MKKEVYYDLEQAAQVIEQQPEADSSFYIGHVDSLLVSKERALAFIRSKSALYPFVEISTHVVAGHFGATFFIRKVH